MWHRFHRRELRPARAPAAPLDDGFASRDPAPEEVAADRDALRAVHEALGELPERERAAVLLRSLGLGLDDVAASLGVSARRARKLSDAGHRRLAAQLESVSAGERCAAVASTLRALSLGWEIAGRRRMRLERHLTACPGCRATVAALRREGRIAVMPVALAGGSEDGARGLVEHAAQAVARVWDRAPTGGAEASTGVLGGTAVGGALATKLVAGCVAVGVGAGCVVVVARDEPRRAPAPTRPAATPDLPATAGEATPPRSAGVAGPQPSRARAAAAPAAERRRTRRRAVAERKAAEAPPRHRTVAAARTRGQGGGPRRSAADAAGAAADAAGAAADGAGAAADPGRPQQNIGEAQAKSEHAAREAERAASDVGQALEEAFGAAP